MGNSRPQFHHLLISAGGDKFSRNMFSPQVGFSWWNVGDNAKNFLDIFWPSHFFFSWINSKFFLIAQTKPQQKKNTSQEIFKRPSKETLEAAGVFILK